MSPQANGYRRRTRASEKDEADIPIGEDIKRSPGFQDGGPGHAADATKTRTRAVVPGRNAIESVLLAFVGWSLVTSLIFGGCCSNVFALEAIVKKEPDSGLLITFTQFLVVSLFTLPNHASLRRALPPLVLNKPAVPIARWLPGIAMFFTVNMMNNFAFAYDISVPVHIILRSGGSVTTMLVGFIWGKRYQRGQIFGVAMLTVGVIVAAMADAQSKGKMDKQSGTSSPASSAMGLFILFVAQLLSAIMGLYVQNTYAEYGPHWHENLFYSHFLSLPLFAPFFPSLYSQFRRLLKSPPLMIPWPPIMSFNSSLPLSWRAWLASIAPETKSDKVLSIPIPTHVASLVLNSLTQYACIRGVNLLGARTSALGVTVVLNLRKLVSLFASIWLFGNHLPMGVAVGAAVVFTGAGIYALGGNGARNPTQQGSKKLKNR